VEVIFIYPVTELFKTHLVACYVNRLKMTDRHRGWSSEAARQCRQNADSSRYVG